MRQRAVLHNTRKRNGGRSPRNSRRNRHALVAAALGEVRRHGSRRLIGVNALGAGAGRHAFDHLHPSIASPGFEQGVGRCGHQARRGNAVLLLATRAVAACKPDPAYAFNRKPAGQRLVHTSQAHHVRHMAFVEQPARRTPQLLARHHHFVANPRAQARLRKLRVAGVARFQRARGAHGRARAASDALRRVHPQLAVHQHDTARRACVGALQARDVAVAHLRAPLLVHHDGLAGHPVQHAHDASVRPQPLARAPVHHSAVFSSMSASTTVLA